MELHSDRTYIGVNWENATQKTNQEHAQPYSNLIATNVRIAKTKSIDPKDRSAVAMKGSMTEL